MQHNFKKYFYLVITLISYSLLGNQKPVTQRRMANRQIFADVTRSVRLSTQKSQSHTSSKPIKPRTAARLEKISTSLPTNIALTFLGGSANEQLAYPPNPCIAVSTSQCVVSTDALVTSFNKQTGASDGLLNTSIEQIFGFPNIEDNIYAFQSQIRYDKDSNRWFILASITEDGYLTSNPFLGISDTSILSNSTKWTTYKLETSPISFTLMPTLGIDKNALYIGTSDFDEEGFFTTSYCFVLNKQEAINGTLKKLSPDFNNPDIFTPIGVDNFDHDSTYGYFAGVATDIPSSLTLIRVKNPINNPTFELVNLNVGATIFPIDVNQANSPCQLWASQFEAPSELADSLLSAHIRDGKLWTANAVRVNSKGQSVESGDRNGTRWYQIALSEESEKFLPSLKQDDILYDKSDYASSLWIGSIMTTGQNNMAIGCSKAGPNSYPNATISSKFATDPNNTIRKPIQFTFSTFPYGFNPNSPTCKVPIGWGNYSFTTLDPSNNMTLWTVQEFTVNRKHWGVQVAKLLAPPPATIISITPTNIASNQTTDITITGQSIDGSGFYDPGVGFPDRLQVSINDNVTVNSITYIDSTHIKVNITTAKAVNLSQATVVVTNPDGQSVTNHDRSSEQSAISKAIYDKYCAN